MSVQIFRSTDSGSPVLNGTAGSLIAVLDHCLVSGLSWTKTDFGGNKVSYTQPGGNHRILQIDDSIGTTANATGWETLTAFNTGTNSWYPTGGSAVQVQKAPLGGPYPIAWRLVSNIQLFHMVIEYYAGGAYTDFWSFGDINSYYSGTDNFATILGGSLSTDGEPGWLYGPSYWSSPSTRMSVDRAHDQTTLNPAVAVVSQFQMNPAATPGGGTTTPCPNSDGRLFMSPYWLVDFPNTTTGGKRGLIPGVWCPDSQNNFADGDRITASAGPLAGRTFEFAELTGNNCQVALEVSDTWGGF